MQDSSDGIFGDERVMHFFIHMKTIVGNCFATLHQLSVDKSHSIRNDDDTQSRFKRALHKSFNVGLRYISGWDETIHEQEALSARKQFPTIEDDYRYTLVQYVKYQHRKRSSRVRMKVPPFQNFLFWLLRRIAATDETVFVARAGASFSASSVELTPATFSFPFPSAGASSPSVAESPRESPPSDEKDAFSRGDGTTTPSTTSSVGVDASAFENAGATRGSTGGTGISAWSTSRTCFSIAAPRASRVFAALSEPDA